MNTEEYATCPFFPHHQLVEKHKLAFHIAKCKKQYKGPKLESCQFNACHFFKKGESTEHYKTCKEYQQHLCQQYVEENMM